MDNSDTIVINAVHGQFRTLRNDHVTRQLELFGAHARNELAMVLSLLRPGDAVIDVGAHIGTFTVAFARTVGENGQVIAIEPTPCPFRLLQENVALNGCSDRVQLHQALVTDEPGSYGGISSPEHTSMTYYVREDGNPTLPCLCLDALMPEIKPDSPLRLIKIDVEGMELFALRSAEALLRKYRPLLYLEVCAAMLGRYGTTVGDVDKFLADHGYALFRNAGARNSTNDDYQIERIASLADGGEFFDCLAIPDERLTEENLPEECYRPG